jgi:hypothetical protein
MKNRAYVNGNSVTMDPKVKDPAAVLLRGDRTAVVGTVDRVLDAATGDTVWYDLEGRTLIPGFNDNHFHAVSAGMRGRSLNLAGLQREAIVDALLKSKNARPDAPYLMGYGWDYTDCPNPHRDILDEHFPDIPVFLIQFSGHAMWINSEGLRRMGVLKSGKELGPHVVVDKSGNPTGIVREASRNPYVRKQMRKRNMNPEAVRSSFHTILPELARAGITTVQDNTWYRKAVKAIAEMSRKSELTCRFSCWSRDEVPFSPTWFAALSFNEKWYHRGPRKFFFDGAFSSHSAWLFDEYVDEPGNYGFGKPAEEIYNMLAPTVKQKHQPACHAIGDRAVHELCIAAERLSKKYPWIKNLRLRIEHAQLIRTDDIARIADLGILVCAQPPALVNPEKDRRLLGQKRADAAYPYRSLLDAGAKLSFGSDYPGESFFEPLRAIHLVVNREGPENISVEEALACYTTGSAFAENREEEKGSVSPGKLADYVILSDNPLTAPPENLEKIQVVQTIVGGEAVYEAEPLARINPGKKNLRSSV